MSRINIQQGDITQLDVDAIVNTANEHLDGAKSDEYLKAEEKLYHVKSFNSNSHSPWHFLISSDLC